MGYFAGLLVIILCVIVINAGFRIAQERKINQPKDYADDEKP